MGYRGDAAKAPVALPLGMTATELRRVCETAADALCAGGGPARRIAHPAADCVPRRPSPAWPVRAPHCPGTAHDVVKHGSSPRDCRLIRMPPGSESNSSYSHCSLGSGR